MTDDPEMFNVPLPPPFPPRHPHGPGAHEHDVLFIRRGIDAEGGEPREHEDIMLRRVPREIAMRYRAAAGGRGMTHAQYLTALVELHAHIRAQADGGSDKARKLLDELGLQTVSV